ncbi:hypothetical protein [Streptomyces sp. NPDC093589]|uniref:hypothetical protein n=1 Tax=Streptomyces sp. NPDC093589 TaxID=3366043 RepID=UPI0037F54B44
MAERNPRDPRDPLDEEAAWAEIVAGYGEQPQFPALDDETDATSGTGGTGDGLRPATAAAAPAKESGAETEKAPEPGAEAGPAGDDDAAANDTGTAGPAGPAKPGGFVVYAPGVGPRSWTPSEPSDDDFDESDEGHFTPPEPPPLPRPDVTTKFAWLAVLGGPLLLMVLVLFQQPVTWWSTLLGIGGFLGGFATLVGRMKRDDEDDDMPGGGAVV